MAKNQMPTISLSICKNELLVFRLSLYIQNSNTRIVGIIFVCLFNSYYFSIPKDPIKRKKWLEALGLKNVSVRARICSKHFREDAFDRTSTKCIRLRDHAIPNVSANFYNINVDPEIFGM